MTFSLFALRSMLFLFFILIRFFNHMERIRHYSIVVEPILLEPL
ncbi:hypothetical protein LEP1GSC127_0780 [Leptospira kirschneri str. 200801925]|nr:hypothetical protein LEP1GSC127_0780 [Leptospira kirschneri str. 200801925]